MPAPLTGTVVGRFLTPDRKGGQVALRGSVTLTPDSGGVRAPLEPATYLDSVTAQLDPSGNLWFRGSVGVVLVATDDPGTNPTGFTYTASFDFRGPDGKRVVYAPFSFSLPAGSVVDLAVAAPQVLSVGFLSVGVDGGGPDAVYSVEQGLDGGGP